jgi:hypothetical protein
MKTGINYVQRKGDTKMKSSKTLWFTVSAIALVLASILGLHACATEKAQAAANDITGAWTVTVSPAAELEIPPFVNLSSITKDGLAISVDDVGLTGLGVWEKASGRTYKVTYEGLFEQDGAKMRYQVRGIVELSADGEHFSGPFINDIYGPDGSLVFSVIGIVEADRMHVIPLE